MIKFDRVYKDYKDHQQALTGVSFELRKGEFAFLTGHSGAGKSTLLNLLTLRECPTRGAVYINEVNTGKIKRRQIPYLRRHVGMIYQDARLLEDYSVFENVALPLVIAGYHPREIGKRCRSALDKVGLLKKERSYPHQLSGGEQQRVGIARAVVNKPPLLLADEPTGNLDPGLSVEIINLFEEFNRLGVTIFVATHDLALIGQLPHRILTLHQGRMVSTGVRLNDELY